MKNLVLCVLASLSLSSTLAIAELPAGCQVKELSTVNGITTYEVVYNGTTTYWTKQSTGNTATTSEACPAETTTPSDVEALNNCLASGNDFSPYQRSFTGIDAIYVHQGSSIRCIAR